jgi:hypothetical protein
MAYTVSKVDIWTGDLEDRVGGLAEKLQLLANAGADLEVVIARRQPHQPGKGVVFLGPIKGVKVSAAASTAQLTRAANMAALRVEGTNKAGECHRLARQLANAGINLRGLSAMVVGKKFVVAMAFDSEADADRAAKVLQTKEGQTK